jgi:hypothetical protein
MFRDRNRGTRFKQKVTTPILEQVGQAILVKSKRPPKKTELWSTVKRGIVEKPKLCGNVLGIQLRKRGYSHCRPEKMKNNEGIAIFS